MEEEQEELTEAIADLAQDTVQLDDVKTDIQQEIKDMVTKMKLLEEDIKGAAVDAVL